MLTLHPTTKDMNDSGFINGLSKLSCKEASAAEISTSNLHNTQDNGANRDKGESAMAFHKSVNGSSPNTKFACGILSSLEQYSQPEEFLYCMRILIFILGSDFSSKIPEEIVSEIVYYLSLFNNIIAQALHNSSPKEFMEQPRIYRQMEYFTSIFWRMVDATRSIYFPQVSFPNAPVQSLEPAAQDFWKSTASHPEVHCLCAVWCVVVIRKEFQGNLVTPVISTNLFLLITLSYRALSLKMKLS